MKQTKKNFLWYGVLFIFSLCIIFFLGKDEAGKVAIKTDAVKDFQLGMDIAGGVKLRYQIDFSEYKQTYTNPTEFSRVKKQTLGIASEKIHERISTLGVSDANVYNQSFDDKDYITVEIGGVNNLEDAKAMIGKTVTLSFKVPVEEVDDNVVAARKKKAEALLKSAQATPDQLQQIADQSSLDGIQYNKFTSVEINQLPSIYARNIAALTQTNTGETLPLLDGIYHTSPYQDGSQPLNGWTIGLLTDKSTTTLTGAISAQRVALIANLKKKPSTQVLRFDSPVGFVDGIKTDNTTLYHDGGKVFSGEEAYELSVYKIPFPSLIGKTDKEIAIINANKKTITQTITQHIQSGAITNNVSGASLLYKNVWKTNTNITDFTLTPGTAKLGIQTFDGLDATYIANITQIKKADQDLFVLTTVHNVSDADAFMTSLRTQTLYTIEDIFVRDMPVRKIAKTTSNEILSAESFKFANASLSQNTRQPNVLLTFDDIGQKKICDITTQYIGKPMAIFVNGKLITSPTIQSAICAGQMEISGKFTSNETRELAKDLNDGAFPIKMNLESEEKISAVLGAEALQGAMIAGVVGLLAIAILLFLTYGWRKMVAAMVVLIFYLTYLLAILKLPFVGYAFSLSGIAAIVLALGMAVDANILIFERTREELQKGKNIKTAINTAVVKSWTPIRDGNISTGLIALLLALLGVGIFSGFGWMLIFTIVLVLGVNVGLTKVMLHLMFNNKKKYIKK